MNGPITIIRINFNTRLCCLLSNIKMFIIIMFLQKKDLGCKLARRVVTLEEEKVTPNNSSNKQFWQFLGCSVPPSKVFFFSNFLCYENVMYVKECVAMKQRSDWGLLMRNQKSPLLYWIFNCFISQKVNPPGPPEEDEEYEISINDLNLVWSVDLKTNELIPDDSFWGCAPKYELLEDTTRVLVFDFGSEVYVWNGKSAPFETRRLGVKLAKDLWEKGLEGTAPVEGHPLIPDGKMDKGS